MGVYKQMDECEGEIIEGLTDEYNIETHMIHRAPCNKPVCSHFFHVFKSKWHIIFIYV